MKRIIICCDGTWSTFDAKNPTNVVRFFNALAIRGEDGIENSIFYDQGIGTGKTAFSRQFDRVASGVFGIGVLDKVETAYRFLTVNYNPGDQIHIVGFSRGAFTARSLAGLIRLCGISEESHSQQIKEAIALYRERKANTYPDNRKALEFRAKYSPSIYMSDAEYDFRKFKPGFDPANLTKLEINYIGVWETVGALGIPKGMFGLSDFFNRNSQFHDTELSALVKSARHAVAIDEMRKAYEPSLWTNLNKRNRQRGFTSLPNDAPFQQHWFPGDHSAVGGGKSRVGLSSQSLLWIIEGAQKAGLAFKQHELEKIKAEVDFHDALTDPNDIGLLKFILWKRAREGLKEITDIDISAQLRWREEAVNLPEQQLYRPKPLLKFADQLNR